MTLPAPKKYRAKTNVNMRSSPDSAVNNNKLAVLLQNSVVTATSALPKNGFIQVNLGDVWVSAAYLESLTGPQVPPTPVPNKRAIKLGLHLGAGGGKQNAVELYRRMNNRGTPFSIALVLLDVSIAQQIKIVSPSTFVCVRFNVTAPDNNPLVFDAGKQKWVKAYTGAEWFAMYGIAAPGADCVQLDNEMGLNDSCDLAYAALYNEFSCELMTAFTRAGRKVAIGNIAPGHVEDYHLPALQPMFRQCEAEQHYLNYHAYTDMQNDTSFQSNSAFYSLRWVEWVKNYPKLQVFHGEVGIYNAPRQRDTATNVRLWGEYLAQVKADNQVIGGCEWTDTPTPDWESDRVNLVDFENWAVSLP